MKATVPKPIRQRAGDDLAWWANREIVPLLTQLRNAANLTSDERSKLTTPGDASVNTIWSSTMRSDAAWIVEAIVIGVAPTAHAMFMIRGLFLDVAGVTTQLGVTTLLEMNRTDALFSADFAIVGEDITITVTSNTTELAWTATTRVSEGASL